LLPSQIKGLVAPLVLERFKLAKNKVHNVKKASREGTPADNMPQHRISSVLR